MKIPSVVSAAAMAAVLAGCAALTPLPPGVRTVDPAAAAAVAADPGVVIVDLSSPAAFAAGHLPRAISIPRDQLWYRAAELPSSPAQRILVYDEQGLHAHSAGVLINDETGDATFVLAGGWKAWRRARLAGGDALTYAGY